MSRLDDHRVVVSHTRFPFPVQQMVAFMLGGALTVACGSTGHQVSGGTTGAVSGTSSTGGTTGGTAGLAAGEPCTGNDQCASDICGVFGTGNCCAAQCTAAADPTCNPTACDAISGACTYPVGRACGTPSCSGNMLTTGACDATGACKAALSACPSNLACSADGTTCLQRCGAASDCAAGTCNAGLCKERIATGACTEDDDCTSGICGTHGEGNCCNSACPTVDPVCGARGCDSPLASVSTRTRISRAARGRSVSTLNPL